MPPLPDVSIALENGQLGAALQTADGVCGLVVTGVSAGSITAGAPFLVTRLSDAEALGLAAATNAKAYKEVSEFYNEAGDGAKLYVMLVPSTMKVNMMADNTNTDGAKKLLDYANGTIRLLGLLSDDTAVYTTPAVDNTAAINADVYTAVANMQTLANAYFAKQWPFRCIIGGTSYSETAADATPQTTSTYNRSAIFVGDTISGDGAAIGLVLGRLSKIPVQRKISRVKDGPVASATAFLGTKSVQGNSDPAVLHDAGFMTFRTISGKTGFYFANDFTCSKTTDDYHYLARGRVIDKAQIIAYATFVEELDDDVDVDPVTGFLDAGYVAGIAQEINDQLRIDMISQKNCNAATVYIDPEQNIIANSKLDINLGVEGKGYSSDINVSLGFYNPANG